MEVALAMMGEALVFWYEDYPRISWRVGSSIPEINPPSRRVHWILRVINEYEHGWTWHSLPARAMCCYVILAECYAYVVGVLQLVSPVPIPTTLDLEEY
jgi:hypothetical protein